MTESGSTSRSSAAGSSGSPPPTSCSDDDPTCGWRSSRRSPSSPGTSRGTTAGCSTPGCTTPPGRSRPPCAGRARSRSSGSPRTHGIAVRHPGKLVVALTEAELPRLDALRERAEANSVEGLEAVGPERIRELEPRAAGIRGLWSPRTGIVDFRAVALAIADEVRGQGGRIDTGRPVTGLRAARTASSWRPVGASSRADRVIACAGLQADRVAAMSAMSGRTCPGSSRSGATTTRSPRRRAGLVTRLLYPVPDPRFPFLGVHFTPRIDGEVWAGPNAVLALRPRGLPAARHRPARPVRDPRLPRLPAARRAVPADGPGRDVARLVEGGRSCAELQRYLPDLRADQLTFGPSGVRAQALAPDGTLVDDFSLGGSQRILHVHNAPSPAATALARDRAGPRGARHRAVRAGLRPEGAQCRATGRSAGGSSGRRGSAPSSSPARAARPRRRSSRSAAGRGERAAAFAAEHGIARAHPSYDDLLEDPLVEAVYVCLPNALHHPWTMRALAARKHVLCEKPYSRRPDEVEAAFDLAERAGLVLSEAFMWRHHPQVRRLVELLPEIGRLETIRARFSFVLDDPADIRLRADLDGGSLMDVGCYCVSGARLLAGEEPDLAFGVGRRRADRRRRPVHRDPALPERGGRRVQLGADDRPPRTRGDRDGRLGPAGRSVACPAGRRSSGTAPSRPLEPADPVPARDRGRQRGDPRAPGAAARQGGCPRPGPDDRCAPAFGRCRAAAPSTVIPPGPGPAAFRARAKRRPRAGDPRASRRLAAGDDRTARRPPISSRLQARTRIDGVEHRMAALAGGLGRVHRRVGVGEEIVGDGLASRRPGRSRCSRRRRPRAAADLDRPAELGEESLGRRRSPRRPRGPG